jgi:RNase adaptor protein for sRNA GlmZ degradation
MSNQETLILTGMSGAGRSTVAHALEDLGWYVVDNLPPALLPALVSKGTGPQGKELAVVVDVRGGEFFDELTQAMDEVYALIQNVELRPDRLHQEKLNGNQSCSFLAHPLLA